jgi:hypothetical protein
MEFEENTGNENNMLNSCGGPYETFNRRKLRSPHAEKKKNTDIKSSLYPHFSAQEK